MPERPIVDIEDLIVKRVDLKFKKFTEDVLEQHRITQEKLDETIKFIHKSKFYGLHIGVLYCMYGVSMLVFLILLLGG